jgi:hypothetical protein
MRKQNLDIYAAKFGQAIADIVIKNGAPEDKRSKIVRQAENHVTKSLGILQENGLYALFLYQEVEPDFIKKEVAGQCRSLLEKEPVALLKPGEDLFAGLRKLCSEFGRLFFAKDLIERVLVYARYHLKAGPESVAGPGGDK